MVVAIPGVKPGQGRKDLSDRIAYFPGEASPDKRCDTCRCPRGAECMAPSRLTYPNTHGAPSPGNPLARSFLYHRMIKAQCEPQAHPKKDLTILGSMVEGIKLTSLRGPHL